MADTTNDTIVYTDATTLGDTNLSDENTGGPVTTEFYASDDDIERTKTDIEKTRANMGETLDAIREKLNPQLLMDQAKTTIHAVTTDVMGQAKSAVQDATGNLTATVHTIVSDVSDHAKETAKDAATGAVSGAVGEVKDAVSGAVTATREAVGTAYDTTKKAGSSLLETAKNNPVPTLLLLGAGWYFLSNRNTTPTAPSSRWESSPSDARYAGNSPYAAQGGNEGYAGRSAGESSGFIGSLIDTAKRNPLPAAALVGTAVHLYNSSRVSAATPNHWESAGTISSTISDAGDAISGTLHSAGEKASAVAGSAKEAIGSATGAIGDAVSGAKEAIGSAVGSVQGAIDSAATTVKQSAGQATHAAGEFMGTVSDTARNTGVSVIESIRENPLPAAAWALGIGVTIALLLPDTAPENRLLGKTRDNLIDTAQKSAGDLLDKVQGVSSKALEAVTDSVQQEAKNQGLTV